MATKLGERLAILESKLDAAHARMDKNEKQTLSHLSEISKEVKDITAWMNRGKGWAAAALLLAGLAGSAIAKLFFK